MFRQFESLGETHFLALVLAVFVFAITVSRLVVGGVRLLGDGLGHSLVLCDCGLEIGDSFSLGLGDRGLVDGLCDSVRDGSSYGTDLFPIAISVITAIIGKSQREGKQRGDQDKNLHVLRRSESIVYMMLR
jgi:hypothetical protein